MMHFIVPRIEWRELAEQHTHSHPHPQSFGELEEADPHSGLVYILLPNKFPSSSGDTSWLASHLIGQPPVQPPLRNWGCNRDVLLSINGSMVARCGLLFKYPRLVTCYLNFNNINEPFYVCESCFPTSCLRAFWKALVFEIGVNVSWILRRTAQRRELWSNNAPYSLHRAICCTLARNLYIRTIVSTLFKYHFNSVKCQMQRCKLVWSFSKKNEYSFLCTCTKET